MYLRQLRYFIALAETLHFGKAAQRLHITQPPLSRQIAALENELGILLLARNSRSVSLTPAGEDFYHNAKQLVEDLYRAIRSAQSLARMESGVLRIGFTMYAAWNVLPCLLKCFEENRPELALDLNETLTQDLIRGLHTTEMDIGITFATPTTPPIRYMPLFQEKLCVVLPASHPLCASPTISAAALAAEPFIVFPRFAAPALHDAIIGCCEHAGFHPKIRLEAKLLQTIINLVAADFGVSLVPESMNRLQLPGAVFRKLSDITHIEQGLYWNERSQHPHLQAILACASALNLQSAPSAAQ